MRGIILSCLALTACDADKAQHAKVEDAKYRAALASRGVGRFQLVQATDAYPAFVLDTVTGCLNFIHINSNTKLPQKLPVDVGDHACLGDMPRDQEREVMEALKK